MKFKQFTKVVAVASFGSAFCFLASCKDTDKGTADQTDKPAQVATNKVPVYIVTVSGTG